MADAKSNVLPTKFNKTFADKAVQLTPKIHEWSRIPQRLVRFETDEAAFFGYKPVLTHTIDSLPSLLWGKGDDFILDFGIHLVGYLSFTVNAEQGEGINPDAPLRLRLIFGESARDVAEDLYPCNSWISSSWLPDEIINIDDFPETINWHRRHAFRFVRVQVIDASPKYKVSFFGFNVRTVSSVSPTTSIEDFGFSDTLLEGIDKVCTLTLRDCMQTVFEDGPRRDRRLWIGDLRLQALASYATIGDLSLVKRCLYLFASVPRDNGSLPACLFESKEGIRGSTDYIVDYDALYGATVNDYVVASGDIETGKELWPTVLDCMKTALLHISETGSFDSTKTEWWKFLDWAPEPIHHDAGLHGVVIYCCKAINNLAILISEPEPFTSILSQMTTSTALSPFYDPQTRCFISGPNHQVSLASAAWLTLSGAFPASTCKTALLNALHSPTSVKPQTPYLFHHVAEALAISGAESESLSLILSYWGTMITKGDADTFWECFDPENPRASPYNLPGNKADCQNNSFCHAWSCTPAVLLRGPLKEAAGAMVRGKITMEELDQLKIKGSTRREDGAGKGKWWWE